MSRSSPSPDIVAELFQAITPAQEPTRAALDQTVRAGRLGEADLPGIIDRLTGRFPQAASRREHLLAAALWWNDYIYPAPDIMQRLHDPDGSYLHGLMHRREGDADNARSWFARAPSHPVGRRLPSLARAQGLEADGDWTPAGLVGLCTQAVSSDDTARIGALVLLQGEEFRCLLGHLLRSSPGDEDCTFPPATTP